MSRIKKIRKGFSKKVHFRVKARALDPPFRWETLRTSSRQKTEKAKRLQLLRKLARWNEGKGKGSKQGLDPKTAIVKR